MKNIQACLTSKSDLWRTPLKLYERFMIKGYFDPCPVNPNFDGLDIDWKENNFVNPPYSQISKWINKAVIEMSKGCRTVMLIPARVDTQWFKQLVLNGHVLIRFIEGRLKFNDYKCAPFPSMFVIFDRTIENYPFSSLKTFGYTSKFDLLDFVEGKL